MEAQTEMPSNTTAGSTLQEEELQRILQERKQACLDRLSSNATPPPEPYCPLVFDGWSCWPDTPGGTSAFAPCPDFVTGFDASRTDIFGTVISPSLRKAGTYYFSFDHNLGDKVFDTGQVFLNQGVRMKFTIPQLFCRKNLSNSGRGRFVKQIFVNIV